MAKKQKANSEPSPLTLLYMQLRKCGMPEWTFFLKRSGYVGAAGIAALGDTNAAPQLADHAIKNYGGEVRVWRNSSANMEDAYSAQLPHELDDEPLWFGTGQTPAWATLRACLVALTAKVKGPTT